MENTGTGPIIRHVTFPSSITKWITMHFIENVVDLSLQKDTFTYARPCKKVPFHPLAFT